MQKKTNALNKYNMYLKYFILLLLLIQLIDSSINNSNLLFMSGVHSDKGNFFEWTLTATVISMFLSIGLDANKYEFVFTESLGDR